MKGNDNIDDIIRRYLPSASQEDADAAQWRIYDQLKAEMNELDIELAAGREPATETGWPGEMEPLALAATYLLQGEGDAGLIAGLINELAVEKVKIGAVRSILLRLVRRGLLSYDELRFAVTPAGERALERARTTAMRWIDAVGKKMGAPDPEQG
jgi:hypothetical protein